MPAMTQKTTTGAAASGSCPAPLFPSRFSLVRLPGSGFTLPEMLVAVVLLGLVTAMAWPMVGRMRAEAAVRGGGAGITVGVAQARAAAVRYSRPSRFVLDTAAAAYRVEVDTTLAETGAVALVSRELPELAGLVIHTSSDPAILCFDARGVGRSGGGCPAGLTIVLGAGGRVDTLAFTATGRLMR